MKRLTTLAAVALGIALLASAAPASAAKKPAARVAAYKHYVACGLSRKAKPSHTCPKGSRKGAFFRSNKANVFYTVCVRFSTGRNLCAPKQEAVRGTLYVNKITLTVPGEHRVTWFVQGKRVGAFNFTVSG